MIEQNDTDALRELVEKLQVDLHVQKVLIAQLNAQIDELKDKLKTCEEVIDDEG